MKKAMAVILAAVMALSCAAALAEAWTCEVCGLSGNTRNFCPECGAPKPAAAGKSAASSSVRAGDSVFFGRTEQDNNTHNGDEPIEWVVLETDGDRALVMTKLGIVAAKYTNNSNAQTWANCTLRETLNGSWYYASFTSAEKSAIQVTAVTDGPDDWDPAHMPNAARDTRNTEDRIFILSYGEISRLLPTANERRCYASAYVSAHGGNARSASSYCWYWLRNPAFRNNAGAVDTDGTLATCYMNHDYGIARPACWVSLSALGY